MLCVSHKAQTIRRGPDVTTGRHSQNGQLNRVLERITPETYISTGYRTLDIWCFGAEDVAYGLEDVILELQSGGDDIIARNSYILP